MPALVPGWCACESKFDWPNDQKAVGCHCTDILAFLRRSREGPAGFEDGTASYLGIAALPHGFGLIQRLGGFGAIHAHTQKLTRSGLPPQGPPRTLPQLA